MILNADLSQIEWRVAAFLSQDKVAIAEINTGIDAHSDNCVNVMQLKLTKQNRYHAKRFLFRLLYGGTAWGFFKDSTMPKFTIKKWKQIVEDFYTKYVGLKIWQDKNIKHVIQGNGTLTLFTGRSFHFILDNNGKYIESTIKNYPVQGIAGGDLLPLAGIIIYDAMKNMKLLAKPLLTVHDSLVFSIKSYWGVNWNVNLTGEVEVGKNYGSLKKIRG